MAMKAYISNRTEISPYLCFDPLKNYFEISGVSRPEDVRTYYYPVIEWLSSFSDELFSSGKQMYTLDHPLVLTVKLEYFNSSSAKFLFDIFIAFGAMKNKGIPVNILWYYESEDEDMKDAGEEIAELAEMEFQFIPVQNLK